MPNRQLPITCPLCGKKNEFPVEDLKEGLTIQCPRCHVKLSLHGHLWEEIATDIARMEQEK